MENGKKINDNKTVIIIYYMCPILCEMAHCEITFFSNKNFCHWSYYPINHVLLCVACTQRSENDFVDKINLPSK